LRYVLVLRRDCNHIKFLNLNALSLDPLHIALDAGGAEDVRASFHDEKTRLNSYL
jgi:hypothetical protein